MILPVGRTRLLCRERGDVTANATSPASSGPAGSHFEGQVGAHYLLSMLTGTEPRGLPGTAIDRIELQRAPEGRALDSSSTAPRMCFPKSGLFTAGLLLASTSPPAQSYVLNGVKNAP